MRKLALFLIAIGPWVAAAEKPAKAPVPRAAGVKIPGVQIPFANLVAEADLTIGSGNPSWVGFAQPSLYVPLADSIAVVNGRTNKVGDPIAGLTQPCGGMVSAFGSVWAPQCGGAGALVRIDPKTAKITATIDSGVAHGRGIIASSSDSLWLLTDDKTTLSRIDPDQNLVVGDIRLPVGCQGVMFAEKSIWVACPSKNKVLRINPATNVLEQSIEVSTQPIALAAGTEGAVWVLCKKEGKLDRIDSKTNKVAKSIDLGVPDVDGAIAYGEGWLWVTQPGYPLARIDAKLETVAQQFYGAGGGISIATSTGALWLGTPTGVKRIDPKRVIATLSPE